VLEIGCGQGDSTVVLADAVGETGHVDAYDPASPDYGRPITLGQAQALVKEGELGPRITFHRTLPPASENSYDFIVLSHSIYYFASPAILPALLSSLPPSTHLCIAEWSLHSSSPASVPHVLTALLLSLLESKREVESSGNIRTVLSPSQISSAVEAVGWVKESSELQPTGEGLRHAYWEARDILAKREKILNGEGMRLEEGERTVVRAMFDAIAQGVEGLGGLEGVKCMDVWVAKFRREG